MYLNINIKLITFLLISAILTIASAEAQIQSSGEPPSLKEQSKSTTPIISMPKFDTLKNLNAKATNQLNKEPLRYAKHFSVTINPETDGKWTNLSDSGRYWKVGISSPGAYSMNVIISPFHLPQGAKLFMYNANKTEIRGPFTSQNNNSANKLAIAPVSGDQIYIELYLPSNAGNYKCNIVGVSHDYANIFSQLKSESHTLKASENDGCNPDINCSIGKNWQTVKNAVFKYIFPTKDEEAWEICTGTLVNNTRNNGIPYFLTAQHCIEQSDQATSVIAFLNYESYYCNGPGKPDTKTLSGANIVSSTNSIDFLLGKFNNAPPFTYYPYYAGINATGNTPESSYCIHHPNGNLKKICIDNDPPVSDEYDNTYLRNSHWKIARWDTGATRPGSSGSPLFNKNKQIVGTLVGGAATCDSPVRDYFAKMSFSWAYYKTNQKKLQPWLDPAGSANRIVDGYNPYQSYTSYCDTITAFTSPNQDTLIQNNDGGYWSGHNTDGLISFAEMYPNTSTNHIYGTFLKVAKSIGDKIFIHIWDNKKGKPGKEISEITVDLNRFQDDTINFIEFHDMVEISDTFFVGYTLPYQDTGADQDTFACYQSKSQIKAHNYFVNPGFAWETIDSYTDGTITGNLHIDVAQCSKEPPVIYTDISNYNERTKKDIALFPNPADQYLKIQLPESLSSATISIIDISGTIVTQKQINNLSGSSFIMKDISNLKSGMYFLKIKSQEFQGSKKLIIMH